MSNRINKNAIRPLLVYIIQFKGIMAQHQLSDKTSSAEEMMTNKNVSTDFTCPGNKKKLYFTSYNLSASTLLRLKAVKITSQLKSF